MTAVVRSVATVCLLLSFALSAGCGLGQPEDETTATTAAPERVSFVVIGSFESVQGGLDGSDASWPRLMFRDHLPRQTVFADLAVPGATVAEARAQQLPLALDLRPTLAVVWLIADDVAQATPVDEYRRQLGALVDALRDAGARVLLASATNGGATAAAYADAVRTVADATGARLVDVDRVRAADGDTPAALAAAFAAA